jgi:Flp pilus assembly protein TadD
MNRLIIAISCGLFAGCVGAPPRVPSSGSSTTVDPAPRPADRAATLLLRQSRTARDAGLYEDATNAIERALRIEPNNPYLWIELGEIKYEDGDRAQAELMARKALTLSAGDRGIETRARRLMER